MSHRLSAAMIVLAASALAMLSGGCRSDAYYQDRAVERARKYLLEEAPGLSAEEKYFITFNDPVFLTSPIIGSRGYVKDRSVNAPVLTDQLNQICVSWKLPGRDDWYMVYGASNERMDFWYPDRVIRKKFSTPNVSDLEKATDTARNYARNNLFGLMNTAEQNLMRFHFPAVYETKFALNFDPAGQGDEEKIAAERKAAAAKTQYSLVWEMPDGGDPAVFCGTGGPEMAGWKLNFAGRTTAEELRINTVRRIKTPEEFYVPFPKPYAKPAEAKRSVKEKK